MPPHATLQSHPWVQHLSLLRSKEPSVPHHRLLLGGTSGVQGPADPLPAPGHAEGTGTAWGPRACIAAGAPTGGGFGVQTPPGTSPPSPGVLQGPGPPGTEAGREKPAGRSRQGEGSWGPCPMCKQPRPRAACAGCSRDGLGTGTGTTRARLIFILNASAGTSEKTQAQAQALGRARGRCPSRGEAGDVLRVAEPSACPANGHVGGRTRVPGRFNTNLY